MSRKAIGALYMLGISFDILGIVELVSNSLYGLRSPIVEIMIGMLFVAASILGTIAWIGMLVNLARAQAWTMFTLAFFFSGIILLIYLFSNAQAFAAKTSPQLQYGMPPQQWPAQPGNTPYPPAQYHAAYSSAQVPAPVPGDVIFKYGLIGGGILQAITLVWLALNDFVTPFYVFVGNLDLNVGDIFFYGIPVLLSLPVFFLAAQAAVRRVGQPNAGLATALRAWGWVTIINGVLFLIDMLAIIPSYVFQLTYSTTKVDILYVLRPAIVDILQTLLFLGVACGLGALAGRAVARSTVDAQQANIPH